MLSLFYVCSLVDPQNIAALGTGEKTAVLEKGGKGSRIQPRKKHIRDLKISGGIRGEVVNGGAVLGQTTVYNLY